MSDPEIITLGCRLNAYESEVMRQHAADVGLHDTVIINTCAVTAEAVRQATQTIRRIRRDKPSARIVVTGCAAQVDSERFADMSEVSHVVGNAEKLQPETFRQFADQNINTERVQVDDIMSVRETAPHMIDGFGSRARAYVQIQNGCDHRCTFCVIPFGRGPSRSVPAGEIVQQVRRLVENGYPEVVLTGVDITSYGPDLPGEMTLGKLVRQVLRHVPELKRLRISSIDQVEVDSDLLKAIAEEERLMPHLHLSMQAGDNLILKRMKRRHLRADAIKFCETARRLRPEVVFGADLIAGFPTETEEMFARSLDIVDECGLTYLHVFPYSPRESTPAARMSQLPRKVVKERAARLRAKGEQKLLAFQNAQQGQTYELLMEKNAMGRTPQFAEVHVRDADNITAGTFLNAKVIGVSDSNLVGEVRL